MRIDGRQCPNSAFEMSRLKLNRRDIMSALPRGVTLDAVTDIGYPFAVRAQADWLGWHGIEEELFAWMVKSHTPPARRTDRGRLPSPTALMTSSRHKCDVVVSWTVLLRRFFSSYYELALVFAITA